MSVLIDCADVPLTNCSLTQY